MSDGGSTDEMQRMLSGQLDFETADGRASAPWLVVGFVLLWFAGTILGFLHPGIEGSPNVVLSILYGLLAGVVYVLAVSTGPVPVRERVLAGIATFGWFYALGPVETAVSRTVEGSDLLAVLVPTAVIVGAVAHVVWRSGFIEGVRHPHELFRYTRKLAAIYGLMVYFAAVTLVLAL